MPAFREALLNAAFAAITDRPWSAARVVDLAEAAGTSRQTIYNEFDSKDGLARALVGRETDRYLLGVEMLLAQPGDPADRLVSVAEWTVNEARANFLLRALLTGCWEDRFPTPHSVCPPAGAPSKWPTPSDLLALVQDRSAAALDPVPPDRCELAVRLALAHVIAPACEPIGRLVRSAVTGWAPRREPNPTTSTT